MQVNSSNVVPSLNMISQFRIIYIQVITATKNKLKRQPWITKGGSIIRILTNGENVCH